MTMLDALKKIAKPDVWMWARPISWRGSGQALCFDSIGGWWHVPDAGGGRTALLPTPKDCFGRWEVVSPDVVNSEVK